MLRLIAVLLAFGFATSVASFVYVATAPEAHSATYSQVVDNGTSGRFQASGRWISSNYHPDTNYGNNNRVLKRPLSISDNAKYKIKIPAAGSYRVLARWPSDPGYNDRTRFLIKTSGGWKARTVNQRTNGGKWVGLGTYTFNAGDSYRIQVSSKSSGKGYIIADAVRIVRATTSTAGGGTNLTLGDRIVKEAETWIGVPYAYGGTTRQGVDCSGLTMRVYEKFGISLPRTTSTQWGAGNQVSSPVKGDLVFFGSSARNIESVGIYSGPGQVIKATVPGDTVRFASITETKNAVGGWVGYRRVR